MQQRGGWKVRETAYAFAEYADLLSRQLGDRVKWWMTLNEPWVSSVLGNLRGIHAPGIQDLATTLQVAHHQLLGHGLALPILRHNATRSDVECGLALSLVSVQPATTEPQTLEAATLHDAWSKRWFLAPLFKGSYPDVLLDNFEWAYGYDKRFGLIYVDYPTQTRIPKDSALWYHNFLTH